ncbi:MAG: hypothetical protein ACI3X7_03075 [Bacteroidaceae bacterium]
MRYWIDDDAGSVTDVGIVDGKISVDVSSLTEGLHTIHYQVIDSDDMVAIPYSGIFLVLPEKAQSYASTLRYWYDDSSDVMTCDANVGLQSLDVSSLEDGLHALHYQVIDTEGKASYVASGIFLKLDGAATPSSNANTLRYWYDDSSDVMTCEANVGLQSLDVSSLEDGLHALHYQVIDTEGKASYVASGIFLKLVDGYAYEEATASELIYWFDDHENPTTVEMADGVQVLDASMLPNGLHTVHYIVVCSDGNVTSAYTSIFLKLDFDNEATLAKSMRYWFDGESAAKDIEATSGVQSLDVSHLSDGLHTVHYQLVDEMGLASIPVSNMFLKIADDVATTAKSLRYWIDDDSDIKVEEVVEGTRALDVSHLQKGLHTLHYQLVDDRRDVSVPMSCMFMKMYDGIVGSEGNAITQYMYWLNDNSKDNKKVQVESPSSSFSLVTLLPMPKEAIRSSNFHFETTSGEPMVYAKNDFHVRFENAMGYWADDSRSFIDYSVSQKVEDIADLKSTQTFARPEANAVKWFSFEGEKGDPVAFRSSQAMSMQVYSPSGKEIYATSADKSVKFDGCHTWEDGTYYVAVHDVTGTRQNVTLDFMHMDRYDVVAQDVHTVGNGGCSTIIFQGNGFDELESVSLVLDNDIVCDSIIHTSNADVSVLFDFTDVPVGDYDAIFKYKEGIKRVDNCVTVEEAKPITINGKVTFNTQYLRSRNNDYVIKLTNKGNSTAYGVPFVIGIFTSNLSNLNYVDIAGVDYYTQLRKNLPQLFTKPFCDSINVVMKSYGMLPLMIRKDSIDYIDEFPAMHKAVMTIDLQPNTTKTITISLNASNKAFLYAWYPSDWQVLSGKAKMLSTRRATIINDTKCNIANLKAFRCSQDEMLIQKGMEPIYNEDCSDSYPSKDCPPPSGGGSEPVNSLDPNDIYGYVSPSGSKFVGESVVTLPYRIEFENDTAFATSSAHVVEIKDTLDSKLFDLATFVPTDIKIGNKTEHLDGTPNFVKTIDMRPAINTITQVEGKFDRKKGIATWTFTSLDPMTMEPTDDVMQGFLPVNHDGISGIGEVSYNISLKGKLTDGKEIPNRASIVFDNNEPILTPTWTNVIDAVSPESYINYLEVVNDSIVRVHCDGEDSRSGIWKYSIYVQYGENASWNEVAEIDTTCFDFRFYEDIEYGFCVIATDSAGNVEQKLIERQFSFRNGEVVDYTDAVKSAVPTASTTVFRAYDLNGRLVQDENQRGIIIKNRKKLLRR